MTFAISALIVLSVFNSFLIFSILAVAGLQRREFNGAVDSLCGASNILSGRVGTLEKVVVNAADCLVQYDAVMSAELEE